jgi:uncharacterized protein YhjY with autotransporter beta-barrel domain
MSRTTQIIGVMGVAIGLWLGSLEPARAQTSASAPVDSFLNQFQDVVDGECPSSGSVPCSAGVLTSAGQVEVQNEGQAQYVIQQRLKAIRCPPKSTDPNCVGVGGASADEEEASFFGGTSVWFSGDYERKDKHPNDFETGFDSDKAGGTIGADKRLGTWGVAGVAITYGHTWGEFSHDNGSFDTDSAGALVYASYYPTDQSFIDVTVGGAYKWYDVSRGATLVGGAHQPVETQGNTTGTEFDASLSGGYDFSFGAFTIGPRLGLNYILTQYDAFTEDSANPLALSYRDQTEDSLTTSVGAQASYAFSTDFGVIVPQVSAAYVHEFLNDQHSVHAQPANNPNPLANVTYQTEEPDRNYARFGAGFVFVLPDGYSPFINYQAEVFNSNETTQTATVGLRIELE